MGTAQQRLFLVVKVVLYAVVVISEVLRLNTKSRCSRSCRHISTPGWQIHPSFHASNLKAYIQHPKFNREVEPPPPKLVVRDLEYEVEVILQHRGKGA